MNLQFNLAQKAFYLAVLMLFCYSRGWATSYSISTKVECIYFQPIFDNDFIPAPNPNGQNPFTLQPGGPGKKNKFGYTPGWRLSLLYVHPAICCPLKKGEISLTCLSSQHAKKMSLDSFLSALMISSEGQENPKSHFSGFVVARHYLNYYAADLWFDHSVFSLDCLHFSIQPGIHYALLQYKNRMHFSTRRDVLVSSAYLKEKSQTGGGGPQLGFKLNYQVCNHLAIQAKARGGLLLSRASAHFRMNPFSTTENSNMGLSHIQPRKIWKFQPFWDTTICLSASYMLYGFLVEMEIGYEYLSYPDYINRIQFPSNGSSNHADNSFSNFDFQGPYISVLIRF